MKKWNRKGTVTEHKLPRRKQGIAAFLVLSMMLGMALCGCAGKEEGQLETGREEKTGQAETGQEGQQETAEPPAGLAAESAADASVDIAALQEENPDIFGWLYIPGTDIDYPVLQSEEADDYYESHDAYGAESTEGALYTELANGKDMCDFMTVIHGKCNADGTGGQFSQLSQFLDRDFFEENRDAYLYLDGNLLTYRIFAAYEREDTSLIRSYDFSYLSGCQQFLDDLYRDREMGKNLREGWEGLTPSHFLVAFTTARGQGKQLVVLAALVDDAAGTIKRAVIE